MAGQEKIPLIVVAGPTASGKTAAAVALAKKLNGEVVSADSMQIYKGMDIATAKPTVAEMEGVPHHLLDFLEPDQAFTVADYVSMAGKVIQDIYSRGKLPILAGGTGLYIHSLVDHIQFTETKNDLLLRSQLQEEAAAYGNVHMLERLRALDPAYAEKLHPNNLNRIIRGLEVCILTGQTMTQQIEESRREESPYLPCMLGLNCLDRQNLYRRINQRVDRMMEMGLLEEAQHLYRLLDIKN